MRYNCVCSSNLSIGLGYKARVCFGCAVSCFGAGVAKLLYKYTVVIISYVLCVAVSVEADPTASLIED
jgi:hypothetical protein